MAIHKPSWFSDSTVMVSSAPTCGLTKGGRLLPLVDVQTGRRIQVADPETGELVDAVNDTLLDDVTALAAGMETDTLRFLPKDRVSLRTAVPIYYDDRFESQLLRLLANDPAFGGFSSLTIAEMLERDLITVRGGHGSPSADQRVGDVPYIKVSDLRAGTLNINPTNRIPRSVAVKQFWKAPTSGLLPYDLLSPERTSKNIGDFCVLMPGQEQVVLTKEVIVLRPGKAAEFDPFYLLWALTLTAVRDQWKRVVFMQTNREDVGKRYHEVRVPIAPSRDVANRVSAPFRDYYFTMAVAREGLVEYLGTSGQHHFFVSGAEELAIDADDAAIEAGAEEIEASFYDPTSAGSDDNDAAS